jgi:hypothetical protein
MYSNKSRVVRRNKARMRRGGSCCNSPAAESATLPSYEVAVDCACPHYLKKIDLQQLHANDAEQAALLLRRLGYVPRYNGASGMHWQRQHSHVWLSPDGALTALGETYAAALAGWAVLSEHTEVPR